MASFARTLRPLARAAATAPRRSRPLVAARCLSTTPIRRSDEVADIFPTPIFRLTETEEAMAEMVQKFANETVLPKVRDMDEAEEMDPAIVESLFEQGLMGVEIPEKYGGAGMNFTAAIVGIEELARVDPSVSVLCDVHNTLCNTAILKWATEENKKRWLPKLATNTVASFCLSEPASGSDAFAMKTRAEKTANGYKINGSKMWITNSKEANFFIVFANLYPEKGYKGITAFVMDKDTKGFSIAKKEKKLGIKASSTCVINFDDVEIPHENLLGKEGDGYKYAIGLLNEGRIGIAAQMTGLAWALSRTQPDMYGTTGSSSANSLESSRACNINWLRRGQRLRLLARSSTTQRERRRLVRTSSWTPQWLSCTPPKSQARSVARPLNGWAVWASFGRAWPRSTGGTARLVPFTKAQATFN